MVTVGFQERVMKTKAVGLIILVSIVTLILLGGRELLTVSAYRSAFNDFLPLVESYPSRPIPPTPTPTPIPAYPSYLPIAITEP
jgi:hypothetical protein